MTSPVRPVIQEITRFPKPPNEMSLREAIEWFKHVVRSSPSTVSTLEEKFLNEQWTFLVEAIAKREDLPVGFLLYGLHTVVTAELTTSKEETE